ncbi:unnamed protein product [Peronospora belbahrii]|uniref:Uncharacterized protein n=1 Tax=Peronospora belbahrii TaxID=622444 RepID=A0ABN8CYV7_9STRA|nr:unnamed protein product [Peronospora belbahrii]
MANHKAENPAAHIVKTDSGSYQLVALRKVLKSESVTISYGDMSNSQLLCRYGFVLPTLMPSDSIHITSSELTDAFEACSWIRDEGKEKAAKRRKLADVKNDDGSLFFLLNGNAEREFGLSDALLGFVKEASRLPAEQLYEVLAVILQDKEGQVVQQCACVVFR